MKKIRTIIPAVALALCTLFAAALISVSFSSCYIVQAQPMEVLKGTYQLTLYTTTNKHFVKNEEGKEVVKTDVTDKIEENGYEWYFVVTGTDRGWFVYKSNDNAGYAKEVSLRYEPSSEDSSKYTYVHYKDQSDSDEDLMGVTKDYLKQARPAVCERSSGCSSVVYHQVGFDRTWTKISDDIDLTTVKEKLGDIPVYSYDEWNAQGVYQGFEGEYLYQYIVLDTYNKKAVKYYALASDGEKKQEEYPVTLVEYWDKIEFNGETWVRSYDAYGKIVEDTENASEYTIMWTRVYRDSTNEATAWLESEITNYWGANGGSEAEPDDTTGGETGTPDDSSSDSSIDGSDSSIDSSDSSIDSSSDTSSGSSSDDTQE